MLAFAVDGFSGVTAKKGALGQIIVQNLKKICNEGTQQGNMTAALQEKWENFNGRDSFGFASWWRCTEKTGVTLVFISHGIAIGGTVNSVAGCTPYPVAFLSWVCMFFCAGVDSLLVFLSPLTNQTNSKLLAPGCNSAFTPKLLEKLLQCHLDCDRRVRDDRRGVDRWIWLGLIIFF